MKNERYILIIICTLLALLLASIALAGNPKSKPFLPDLSESWTAITPEPTEFMGRELSPTCSGAPGTDATFKFFVKGGTVNNLVLFFDGGGACWDTMNCIYEQTRTYTTHIDEAANRLAGANGIFDLNNPANPFKDWNYVFIPYCTGDIHWGSSSTTYDCYIDGTPYTIHHRGFDNFLVVLKWITENYVKPHKILVTGSSAGSYGALLGFPYVQEAFPKSMASMLGDAGFGVVTEDFQNIQSKNWGFEGNLPDWIPGFERPFSEYSIAEMYKMIAQYYPNRKFGQFTNAWDATQAFFYNVMLCTLEPGNWNNFYPVWVAWYEKMLEHAATAAEAPNYRYYIAAGVTHTILGYPDFYNEKSGGVPFIDWVSSMVGNQGGTRGHGAGPWRNAECFDCEDPPLLYP
jgi:hypothetical protein